MVAGQAVVGVVVAAQMVVGKVAVAAHVEIQAPAEQAHVGEALGNTRAVEMPVAVAEASF